MFDQHVLPGGYCHHYPRKARHDGKPVLYRFDAGPHDFSGVWEGGSIAGLLDRLGVADRIEWKRIDHSYRTDEGNIEPPRDWRAYARMLGERFPASAAGVMALFEDIHAIFEDMYATGAGRSGIPGLPDNVDKLLAFPKDHPFGYKWMGRPFDELVAKHVSDPQVVAIINALSGYLHDGTEVLTCAQMVPIFGYYFKGGFYPVGGSGRFSANPATRSSTRASTSPSRSARPRSWSTTRAGSSTSRVIGTFINEGIGMLARAFRRRRSSRPLRRPATRLRCFS